MIFWMARAARGLSAELRGKVDLAVDKGRWALALVAMLAVGREGLETALFLWAATQSATAASGSNLQPLLGAALGLGDRGPPGMAVLPRCAAHQPRQVLHLDRRLPHRVAAGVLSYGVHDLQEAGSCPA